VHEQGHRLVERRGDHAAMGVAGRPLVVLLDEEAPGDPALTVGLDLELEAEQVGEPATEAELVVGDRQASLSSPSSSSSSAAAAISWRST
jgi:hypothetical protein